MNKEAENKELDEYNLIRMFLLHRLDKESSEQLEEKFFCDSEFKEKVLITEEEILEDYVLKNLLPEDYARVQKYLLTSLAQMKKLHSVEEVVYCVKTFSGDFSESVEITGVVKEKSSAFFAFFSNQAVLAAILLVACLSIGTFLFLNRENRHSSLNTDLIRKTEIINQSNESFENTAVFQLLSVVTRGDGNDTNQIFIKPPDKIIECDLVITQTQNKIYQASLSKFNSDPLVTVKPITSTEKNGAVILIVKFPAEVFESGYYQIKVFDISGDNIEEVEVFSFEVTK